MTGEAAEQRDGFFFLGNNLALDFVNTRPVVEGETIELLPDFPALLRWLTAAGVLQQAEAMRLARTPAATQGRVWREMRELRDQLSREFLRWEKTGKVAGERMQELNQELARYPMRLRLVQAQGALVLEEYADLREAAGLGGPIAAAAARLLASGERARVRQCDACVLHFRDVSKKGTRRWCSMQLCGNRAKVAAYASRQRRGRK